MANNADKRARQNANRQSGTSVQSNQRSRVIASIVIAFVVVVGLFAYLFARGSDDAANGTDSGEGAEVVGETTPCPPTEGSAERVTSFGGPPENCIDPERTSYTATFVTTEGSFTAELDPGAAPETVNNFVVLARYGYYDGTPIHRVVPDFVIQGGDGDGEPLGTNDLGYTIDDELPTTSDAYDDYSLAMANAGPNSNGSQFFVVLPGGGAQLQPLYSYFGQVTDGTTVVDAIAALGQEGLDGPPTSDVTVESVEISETPR
ncbi:MAG: peptidylprolyl isomerase [Microthrixaceae bacterium]